MIGYTIVDDQGYQWRMHHKALVPFSMPHRDPGLTLNKAKALMRDSRAWLIRWDEEFDRKRDGAWWHVIKCNVEGLEDLSRNTRSKIRRAMKIYKVARCDRKLVVEHGYAVYVAAYQRYETHERQLSPKDFEKAIWLLPASVEFWGVWSLNDNELVAFSENVVEDQACFYSSIWFSPESLKKYSSYLLFYEMNLHYLTQRDCRYVSDGARSISHRTAIHDFLEQKFRFRKAYATLRVVYAPWLSIIVRLLYPLRGFICRLPGRFSERVAVLLRLEAIRRASGWD